MLVKKRILIAEDDQDIRLLVRIYANREHAEVIEASDGEEALARAQAERPDLILLDLRMPILDGVAVLKGLRTNPALTHIPVIVITAQVDPSTRDAALAQGATHYLTKPFDMDEFITLVAEELHRTST